MDVLVANQKFWFWKTSIDDVHVRKVIFLLFFSLCNIRLNVTSSSIQTHQMDATVPRRSKKNVVGLTTIAKVTESSLALFLLKR